MSVNQERQLFLIEWVHMGRHAKHAEYRSSIYGRTCDTSKRGGGGGGEVEKGKSEKSI
jgi:hypothetical protein